MYCLLGVAFWLCVTLFLMLYKSHKDAVMPAPTKKLEAIFRAEGYSRMEPKMIVCVNLMSLAFCEKS